MGCCVQKPNHSRLAHHTVTPQIAYKVAVCPRGNLLYIRIYFTNNTNILGDIEGPIVFALCGKKHTLLSLSNSRISNRDSQIYRLQMASSPKSFLDLTMYLLLNLDAQL